MKKVVSSEIQLYSFSNCNPNLSFDNISKQRKVFTNLECDKKMYEQIYWPWKGVSMEDSRGLRKRNM